MGPFLSRAKSSRVERSPLESSGVLSGRAKSADRVERSATDRVERSATDRVERSATDIVERSVTDRVERSLPMIDSLVFTDDWSLSAAKAAVGRYTHLYTH